MKKAIVLRLLMAMVVAAIMAVGTLQASEPPKEPILKIETAMHTAMIWRIGVDAANRFLVTCSQDKTVRVWELPSGRLLSVLRPPVGAGDEGKIFAVAISPDGKTVACAGWTELGSDGGDGIYIFDRATGELSRRIEDLPNIIEHLSFSPDGVFLAASLGVVTESASFAPRTVPWSAKIVIMVMTLLASSSTGPTGSRRHPMMAMSAFTTHRGREA